MKNQFDAPRPKGRGLLIVKILKRACIIRALKGAVLAPSKYKGLTFIEIMMVLVLLMILLTIVVPTFYGLYRDAQIAAEKQTIAVAKVGINNYYIDSVLKGRLPWYPAILDSASCAIASKDNPFFTYVVQAPGVIEGSWRKLSNTLYQGYSGSYYHYDPVSGNFEESNP